jgi:putative PIN family toxin of toxin-antitoxin system
VRPLQIVLDTNVLVAALRSSGGVSFRLLADVGRSNRFRIHLSVPLLLEYEDALKRHSKVPVSDQVIDDVLDYLCSVAELHEIFFLWRPILRDPKDEMVLEAAVAGSCDGIVSYNRRDFAGAETFGLWIDTPTEFLQRIGGK